MSVITSATRVPRPFLALGALGLLLTAAALLLWTLTRSREEVFLGGMRMLPVNPLTEVTSVLSLGQQLALPIGAVGLIMLGLYIGAFGMQRRAPGMRVPEPSQDSTR